jgi:hypothetical protein
LPIIWEISPNFQIFNFFLKKPRHHWHLTNHCNHPIKISSLFYLALLEMSVPI